MNVLPNTCVLSVKSNVIILMSKIKKQPSIVKIASSVFLIKLQVYLTVL